MEHDRFEQITSRFAALANRRITLGLLVGALSGGELLTLGQDAAARRKKKRRNKEEPWRWQQRAAPKLLAGPAQLQRWLEVRHADDAANVQQHGARREHLVLCAPGRELHRVRLLRRLLL
jgi:hypothetical protein